MRLKVSPWWLTAACLLGWTIGYGFPGGSNTQSDQIAVVTTVIDTVVVIHERVDTVYREVHLKSLVATSNAAKSKSASPKSMRDRAKRYQNDRSLTLYLLLFYSRQWLYQTRIASAMRQTEWLLRRVTIRSICWRLFHVNECWTSDERLSVYFPSINGFVDLIDHEVYWDRHAHCYRTASLHTRFPLRHGLYDA